MKSHHPTSTCPGCGRRETETPNDECWPCQTDGEARIGERMNLRALEHHDPSPFSMASQPD